MSQDIRPGDGNKHCLDIMSSVWCVLGYLFDASCATKMSEQQDMCRGEAKSHLEALIKNVKYLL